MRFSTIPLLHWLSILAGESWVLRCICCSTLVILATWLAVLSSIRRSAAIRHRIFCLGLTGLLIVPMAITFTAGWNPEFSISAQSNIEPAVQLNRPVDSSQEFVNRESAAFNPATATSSKSAPITLVASVDPRNPPPREPDQYDSPLATSDPEPFARTTAAASPRRIFHLKPQDVFSMVWAVGAILLGIKLASDWIMTRSIIRNAVPITDEQTVLLMNKTIRSMKCLTQCRSNRWQVIPQLLCSRSIPVPIAVGILVPTIILPVGFGKWTNERLRVVLLHELTHLDRRDLLAHIFARLACVIYWFNPLVWLAARRMCLERELACDDFLLYLGESAELYANDLFEIAALATRNRLTIQLGTPMTTQSNLKTRVQHLMKLDLDRRSVSARTSLLTNVMAILAVMILAVISPSYGIALSENTTQIAGLDEASVTLSGELSSDWLERLKSMPKLQKLTIRNPTLMNFKVEQLRELKNLTEFSAEDFSIGSALADSVAANIAQVPHLKSLQFHRTGVTGRGLQALSHSSASELIIDGEELISDADYQHVAMMPSLSTLVVDSTPIETDGLLALQAAPSLRRLALRRHPAGSYEKSSKARINTIAGFKHLVELELGDTGYSHVVPLQASNSLRLLTLRNGGGNDVSKSLQQLTQLKRVEIDNCGLMKESFDDVKSNLAKLGIDFVDVTQTGINSLTRNALPPDEATLLARQVLEGLDVGKAFPSFWIEWHFHSYKIPSMTAVPTRTVHRLKQALTATNERQLWEHDTKFAYAPGQFFMRNDIKGPVGEHWQQTMYGDAKLARSREGRTGKTFSYFLRNGISEFEESLGHHFPEQLSITHQHMWWGTPTEMNSTSSPVSPQQVSYIELPTEHFAGEICRVLQSPGRNERLWISQANRRLRGVLHYIHQGYFTPFYKQDVVTKIVGRRLKSQQDYENLVSGPGAISKETQDLLTLAWSEHEFRNAYPHNLIVLDDYREIAAGKWYPFKVTSSGWHHNSKDEGKYDFWVSESRVKEVAINRSDLETWWAEYLPKSGDDIQDQRYGTAVNYKLDSERTEDDIQKLVNEQLLTFARSAIQIEKAQSPFTNMVGKPAPRLPEEGWIGERPDLTGNRYLIHFWAAWCGPCKNDVPLLNSIAKDRIVIGVHPGDTSNDQVRQAVKDAKMAYPTIVAPHGAPDVMGYSAKMFPYCVEVDEQGNVAKHGSLNEVLEMRLRNNDIVNQQPKAIGTVLAIDPKDGLAVISLGEVDGIQSHQLLNVTREGKSIAQLRVITVNKNRCVGKKTVQDEQATMSIGDNTLSFAHSTSTN